MRSFELKGAAIGGVMVADLVTLGPGSATAAVPMAFPAEQSWIPLVVGGAFVFPAVLALSWALLCRIGRRLGPVASVCMLALAMLAIAGFLQPGFVPLRGG